MLLCCHWSAVKRRWIGPSCKVPHSRGEVSVISWQNPFHRIHKSCLSDYTLCEPITTAAHTLTVCYCTDRPCWWWHTCNGTWANTPTIHPNSGFATSLLWCPAKAVLHCGSELPFMFDLLHLSSAVQLTLNSVQALHSAVFVIWCLQCSGGDLKGLVFNLLSH